MKTRSLIMAILLVIISSTKITAITVDVTAGGLAAKLGSQLSTTTSLTITGIIDARDFLTMRDNMPVLATLVINASIVTYAGTGGTQSSTTSYTYAANTIPQWAFWVNGAAAGKVSLTSVSFPSNLTAIGQDAFYKCTGLTSVSFPASLTSIGIYAFSYCTALSGSLNLPASLTTIDLEAFKDCTGLTGSLTLPPSITYLGTSVFSGCTGFTGMLTIKSVPTTLGSGIFNGCTGITGISLPSSFTSIPANFLYGCSGLTGTLTIPPSVTTINGSSFYGCSGLSSITIPESVTSIGNTALYCTNLTSITVLEPTPSTITLGSNVFLAVNTSTCYLGVPYGSLSLYQAALQWKNFTHIVDALSSTQTSLTLANTASTSSSFTITANKDWTASSNQTWLSLSSTTGSTGTKSMTVTATANTTGSPRTATVTFSAAGDPNITVTVTQKAVPAITWANPSDIVYGTLLSGTQLNASASTPGSYSYSPASGSKLSYGSSQNLTVTFTPTDNANYVSTSATVQINVTKKTLTVTGASANKEYDCTTTATIAGAVLNGIVGTDNVSLTNLSGTFASAGVGNGINVTPNLSLTGTAAGNYSLSMPTITANISAKNLTVTSASASNKVYDGNTSATISGALLSGIISPDLVSLVNATSGTFASANVGSSITVISSMTLTGAASSNYTLNNQPTLAADITQKGLTVSGSSAANKVYDGNASASISGGSLVGIVGTDNVTLTDATNGTFSSSNVGTGIDVTSVMKLTGTASGNYSISQPSLTANITPKTLTVSSATANKKYDGTTEAKINSAVLNGVVGFDDVSLATFTGTFASADVGNDIDVTPNLTLTGLAAGNYLLSQPSILANITAKYLSVTGATVANKVYDGSTSATISGAALSGVISPDVVTLENTTSGVFETASVGNSIIVNSNMILAGASSNNYELKAQPILSANITPKTLTVTGARANKIYDGTTTASITGATLEGIVGSDVVTLTNASLGTFSSINVANEITVTTSMALLGAQAGNYTISQPTLTANISPKNLTVAGAIVANKIYDGNNVAVISGGALIGIVNSDDVALANAGTGTFESANIGTGKSVVTSMSLTGTAANNYSITQPTLSANITPKILTVTGAIAASKAYDGNNYATISGASLFGVVESDNVSLNQSNSGTFTSPGIGTDKTVTSSMTLVGLNSGNYSLVQPTLSANITPKTLLVTGASASNKVYDGNTTVIIAGATLDGIVGEDIVTLANAGTGSFVTANVGNDKNVSTSMSLTGLNSGNYILSQPSLTANIIPKPLSVNVETASKVYDGSTAIALSASLFGIVNTEIVTLVNASSGILDSPNVGEGKSVATSMSLTGTHAGNYTLIQPAVVANVTHKSLTIKAEDKSRDYFSINPIFTYTYSGFVNNENEDVVITKPTIKCNVSKYSFPGKYSISLSGAQANNYNILYESGTLTVNESEIQICLVSVDLETGKNMVIWERKKGLGVKNYNVYRESSEADKYEMLGSLPFSTEGVFVDLTSKPEQQQYRYKLSAVDSLGEESILSNYHQPMFLQYNNSVNGINLSWRPYEKENGSLVFKSYVLYRGTDSTKLSSFKTLSANASVFIDIDPLAKSQRVFYRIGGILNSACNSQELLKAGGGPFVESVSNLEDNRLKSTGINGVETNISLSVYPQPVTDNLTVVFSIKKSGEVKFEIFNLLGAFVGGVNAGYKNSGLTSITIDLAKYNLQNGVYYIRLKTYNAVGTKSFVIKK